MSDKQPTKCWKINLSKIDEGYLYSEMTVYADTLAKAKSDLLDRYKWEFTIDGKDPEYITIPVVRYPEMDLQEFEGGFESGKKIYEIMKERKRLQRLNDLLLDETVSYCYIKKGSYYRPDCCGYTDILSRAGVYTKEEAIKEAKCCQDITIIPINIQEHNDMIQKAIDDLKMRLICP